MTSLYYVGSNNGWLINHLQTVNFPNQYEMKEEQGVHVIELYLMSGVEFKISSYNPQTNRLWGAVDLGYNSLVQNSNFNCGGGLNQGIPNIAVVTGGYYRIQTDGVTIWCTPLPNPAGIR